MKAVVFPGQGAQFVGMGKELYESNAKAKALFDQANEILGYKITDIMFAGTDDELKQTKVTQPAVFLHSVISAIVGDMKPEMVGGHSLGEFSALVASGALRFEDGLKLVYARAMAMQKACELKPSTMAAIIGLPDEQVEAVCQEVSTEESVVVPANYNCPGQLVISGDIEAVEKACEKLKEMLFCIDEDEYIAAVVSVVGTTEEALQCLISTCIVLTFRSSRKSYASKITDQIKLLQH